MKFARWKQPLASFSGRFSLLIIIILVCQPLATSVFGQNLVPITEPEKKQGPDTLVICPVEFQSTLQPWITYRQKQGHNIRVVAPQPTAYENKLLVRDESKKMSQLKFVWLIGDSGDRYGRPSRQVATDFVPAKVNVKFGGDPEIATDNTLADINNDQVPDLAIGRLPVDSKEELANQIERIIDYETKDNTSDWRRRVNFVAGVGGFGQLIDKLIEQSTKQIVTDLIPSEYQTSMTYGSWSSPYCPDPRRFSQTCFDRFNEGCLFWVYIGHGSRHKLDKIYLPDQSHGIMSCEDCDKLNVREGSPIAIFLACYTGAMDDDRDCLAEEMIRQPKGPIAILCGSRVTMPYAMSILSLEMIEEYFEGSTDTLGELVMLAKQRMVEPAKKGNVYRTMIEGMGQSFSPSPELLEKERYEHLQLMHLIGDPLLRVKRPEKIAFKSPAKAVSGQPIEISGDAASEGMLRIELSYKRDRFRTRPPRRKEYDSSDASFAGYQKTYDDARNLVCFRGQRRVVKGKFNLKFTIPDDCNGECVLTLIHSDDKNYRIGANSILVATKAKP